ncbi:MAG: hypothetical protein ABEH78_08140 [Haloferacaceae archaeon]
MDRDEGPITRLLGGGNDGDEEEEDEWQFSLDEVGPDAAETPDAAEPERPLEPESVSLEHAAFVIAGVALTLYIVLTAL